jgi:hypothetical protein
MADRVGIKMEFQAHHMDDQRPGARYPASLLTDIEREVTATTCLMSLGWRLRTKKILPEAVKRSCYYYICTISCCIFCAFVTGGGECIASIRKTALSSSPGTK